MKEYVADFTVRPGLWDNEVETGEIGQKRHTAFFRGHEGEASTVTFCNNCGCAFTTTDSKCAQCGHG